MHPQEMRAARVCCEPVLRSSADLHAATLHAPPTRLCLRMLIEIIVKIKPTIQTGCQRVAIEDDGADKSSGLVARLLQHLSPSFVSWCQRHTKIGDTMRARKQAGQNCCVGRVGDWSWRKRLIETDSVGCQAVHRRSFNILVAVTVHVVGAKRVDRDEENLGLSRRVLATGTTW